MRVGQLSRRTGVSEHRLRVWERRYGVLQPTRTSGNVRLYSAVDEARVRLMTRYLDEGVSAGQAAQLALSAPFALRRASNDARLDPRARTAVARMIGALEAFDESSADRSLQELLREYSALGVIRDVLLPCAGELAGCVAVDRLGPAQAHYARTFVHSRLLALAHGWDEGLGPRALLACGPDDHDVIALMAFGVALHRVGWRITFLGATTPVDVVTATADRIKPALVVVAAAAEGSLVTHQRRLEEVARAYRLVLLGAGVDDQLAERCGARQLQGDPVSAAQAVAILPGLAHGSGPPVAAGGTPVEPAAAVVEPGVRALSGLRS